MLVPQILLILVIAPSAIYALPQGSSSSSEVRPGSAGHHGNVQAGAFPFPQFRPSTRDSSSSSGMPVQGIQVPYSNPDSNPATSQHMSINNDGRYSFSYSAGNSAREERREPDGSVKGKYSYIDPLGKLVEVEYTADAASGFNAYGENVPPRTVSYAPYPVQDTPDVAAARAKFLAYYQQEWNARKELEAIENATATPSPNANGDSSESVTLLSNSNSQAPQASGNGNGNGNRIPVKQQVEDDEDDTEVVNRDESVSDSDIVSLGNNKNNNNNKNVAPSGLLQPLPLSTVSASPSQSPSSNNNNNVVGDGSYSLNFDVGNFHNQFQSQFQSQNQPQPQIQTYQTGTKSGPGFGSVQSVQGPGYFYYMTSGGLPFYVTSLPTRTNVAVSVRAAQLGAIPAAAMHDVQTPHYGGGVYRPKQTPAVYVEVGQDYNELGQTPAGTVTPQHFRQQQGQRVGQSQSGVQAPRYPTNFPFFGYPVYVY